MMRPAPNTRTTSARSAVDRRWATGRLVEDEQPRSCELGPRQRDELTLPGGQVVAALSLPRVEPGRQPRHPRFEIERGEGTLDVGVGRPIPAEADVLADGGVEEDPSWVVAT